MNVRLIAAAAVALALVGCVDREAQKQAAKTEEILSEKTVPVTVADATTTTLAETVDVRGDIVSDGDSVVGARVAGRVVAVYVREGDNVSTGQRIASLDKTSLFASLRQAQAGVAAARSALSQAKSNAAISPDRTASGVSSAEAQLRAAKTNYDKLMAGARDEERTQARIAVAKAASDLETSRKEYERVRALFEGDAVSRQRLEQAQNMLRSAEAAHENALQQQRIVERGPRDEDVIAAREAIRQAEEAVRSAKTSQRLDVTLTDQVRSAEANVQSALAQVDLIQEQIREADVVSPFSGRVSGKPVAVGSVVAPGSPIARVVSSSGTYFDGQLPETLVAQVKVGDAVEVSIDALPDLKFSGSVAAINPLGRELGRLFSVRIQILGLTDQLMPGMFARGLLRVREIPGAVVVPSDAVVTRSGASYVFVVSGDQAKRVDVRTGMRQNGNVQVFGIESGQRVVVKGAAGLIDGAAIRIEDAKEGA